MIKNGHASKKYRNKCQKNTSQQFYSSQVVQRIYQSNFFFCWSKLKTKKWRLTWHVVVSVTPHTIRWIPSTQTFSSITICLIRANYFAKNVFRLFIFGAALLWQSSLLIFHAALQPPRDIMTLSMYAKSSFFMRALLVF